MLGPCGVGVPDRHTDQVQVEAQRWLNFESRKFGRKCPGQGLGGIYAAPSPTNGCTTMRGDRPGQAPCTTLLSRAPRPHCGVRLAPRNQEIKHKFGPGRFLQATAEVWKPTEQESWPPNPHPIAGAATLTAPCHPAPALSRGGLKMEEFWPSFHPEPARDWAFLLARVPHAGGGSAWRLPEPRPGRKHQGSLAAAWAALPSSQPHPKKRSAGTQAPVPPALRSRSLQRGAEKLEGGRAGGGAPKAIKSRSNAILDQ